MFQSQRKSGLEDPKSWPSGELNSSPIHSSVSTSTHHSAAVLGPNGTMNRGLCKDLYEELVEIFPLVQTLINKKATSSFTRRGSVVSTKTPSRDSISKGIEPRGRGIAQSIPTKKKREHREKVQGLNVNNSDADGLLVVSANSSFSEKDMDELVSLKEQMVDLQTKLLEKDELLKSAEITKSQISTISAKFDALKVQAAEKDNLMELTHSQLSDTKIKLDDKQAALERIQSVAMTSNRKVEKLEEELKTLKGDMSSFRLLFESLARNNLDANVDDYEFTVCQFENDPSIDYMDEMEMEKMEEARKAYVAAVAAAKEKKDEESIASATAARFHLQSFVFGNIISDVH